MYENNGDTLIETLHNVLLEPDICDGLFSIIMLMNSGHTYLFCKGFCTVYFGRGKSQDVPFFYTPDHLSEVLSCKSIISNDFHFISMFN